MLPRATTHTSLLEPTPMVGDLVLAKAGREEDEEEGGSPGKTLIPAPVPAPAPALLLCTLDTAPAPAPALLLSTLDRIGLNSVIDTDLVLLPPWSDADGTLIPPPPAPAPAPLLLLRDVFATAATILPGL